MKLPFVPYPQRCALLHADAVISRESAVILQTPEQDERLVRAASALFSKVECRTGSYSLYSQGSFAASYPFARPEGYLLTIREDVVQLSSQDAPGLYYGLQTLRQWMEMPEHPAVEICDWPDLSLRSDYLDLRGLFPKFENILLHLAEMSAYKLNTLVIEYEDKLPRSRKELCAASDALTEEQLQKLLQEAHDHFIDVIPLQQSFGHLEYALKLPQYIHLRETQDTPGEMCPLRDGAFELAASLLEETVAVHPRSRYVHLGCDEVWSLGQSPECKASGKSRGQIAVEFINRLAEKVLSLGKIPVVWHDMLASVWEGGSMGGAQDYEALAAINKNIVVAVWLYSPELVNEVAPELMERLHALGIRTIPCSAVRASDMSGDQNYPEVEQRLRNIDAWCELIDQTRSTGMINTNWCSTFSLGNPYGLFETSRYTAFYAADRCWNLHADSVGFLERFLAAFHGVYHAQITSGTERRYDYYKIIGQFLPQVTRNKLTAELIDVMRWLEYAVPVNFLTFRGDYFKGSEVELTMLRERATKNYPNLRKAEDALRKLLPQLLSEPMAELFFESRSYPNRLFQRELERILGLSLNG